MIRPILSALTLLTMGACQPVNSEQNSPMAEHKITIPEPREALDPLDTDGGKRIILAVRGYNYTSRDIDSFTIAGSGGHAPSGGSGGVSVGASIPKDIPWDLLEFKVRWAASGCIARGTNSYGESSEVTRYFYKEKVVKLKNPLPANPDYLEVHFYPNNVIEVVVTELASDPQVPASNIKEDLSPYPPCEDKKS